jgi:hypothetical protein
MSKGWESKSVESQMESAEERRAAGPKAVLTEDQKKKKREREGLLLARANLLRQLDNATNDRYRQTLQNAIREIDGKVEELK